MIELSWSNELASRVVRKSGSGRLEALAVLFGNLYQLPRRLCIGYG